MNVIISLAAILLISYLLVYFGKRIKIPSVVMLIFTGLLFNISILEKLFISENLSLLLLLGNIGLFVLMFLAGLEVSWRQLYEEKRNSAFIATFASFLPFILGAVVFVLFGFPFLTSAMVGVCMAITAEATKARVLIDLKKIKTRIGAAMMGAGIIDDVIGLVLFMIIALLFGSLTGESLMALGVIASFFVGIISSKKIRKNIKERHFLEKILLVGIVPFFFISMGIHFDFKSLIFNPLILVVMVFLGIFGKIAGVFLTKKFTRLKNEQLLLVGWAMNSRGAIELALALIALNLGILTVELYSSIIVMGLVTTLIFPFVITHMIKKYKGIMK